MADYLKGKGNFLTKRKILQYYNVVTCGHEFLGRDGVCTPCGLLLRFQQVCADRIGVSIPNGLPRMANFSWIPRIKNVGICSL